MRLRSHSRLPLDASRSPPADRFQLTCSVSQPTLTAQPFPCGLVSGRKPSGLRPTPTYHFTCTYVHLISHLTTPLSHTRQLSAPRHRPLHWCRPDHLQSFESVPTRSSDLDVDVCGDRSCKHDWGLTRHVLIFNKNSSGTRLIRSTLLLYCPIMTLLGSSKCICTSIQSTPR